MELACQAGYRGNTIGLPRMVPEELLEKCAEKGEIQKWVENLMKYRKDNYSKSPSFIGIGVTQEELTNAVESNAHIFANPSWVSSNMPFLVKSFWVPIKAQPENIPLGRGVITLLIFWLHQCSLHSLHRSEIFRLHYDPDYNVVW